MSLVSRAFNAVVVVMILAPISVADDRSGVSANPELATTIPRLDIRPGQVPLGLKMRRRYEPGKIPVVLVHGLWGFPQQWDRMVEYLEGEPDIRERYQFWLFGYESGDSIPFSAHLLRQSLRQARLLFDPKGTDEAFDRLVVVGHSLGGILAKMMGHDSGSRLWQTVCDLPIDKIAGPQDDCLLLRQVYFGTRLKYIHHPSFDDPTAWEAILAPLTHTADDQVSRRPEPSDWLTPFPNGRSGPPFVSREQEAHLFRKMNYLKWRANQLRE